MSIVITVDKMKHSIK